MRAYSWLVLLAACAPPSRSEAQPNAWGDRVQRSLQVADHAIDLGTYSAHFPAQGTEVRFTDAGASARTRDGGLVLSVVAMGRGEERVNFEPVEPVPGEAMRRGSAHGLGGSSATR